MYSIQGGIFMNSILTPMAVIKVLMLSALCTSSLTSCYVQPNSQVGLPDQPKPTQLQSAASPVLPMGRYVKVDSPAATQLIVEVTKTGMAMPAKEIKINLSNQSTDTKADQTSCRYQGLATLMGQDALHGMVYTAPISNITTHTDGTNLNIKHDKGLIFFRFKDNILSVDSNNPEALSVLCQGNNTLKGDYTKSGNYTKLN